jgi:hypothetical protein
MHAEDWHQIDTGKVGEGGNDLRTVALWTSTDQGGSWEYQGPVLTIADEFALPGGRQTVWPKNGGAGDHKLVLDPAGTHMYLVYTNFTYDPPEPGVDSAHGNLAVARAELSTRGLPGSWWKYYRGDFSEPGVGGRESWVMSPYEGEFDNSQRSVIWSTYLNCYVMVLTVRTSYCRISYSSDLVNWTPSQFLYGENTVGINYASLIDATFGGTDQEAGRSMWLYYTRKDYQVHRRLLTFDRRRDLSAGARVTTSNGDRDAGAALTDGDRGTTFTDPLRSPVSGTTTWLEVDLGSVQEFGTVVLSPTDATGAGFPRNFSIEVASQPAGPWSMAARYDAFPAPRSGETQVLKIGTTRGRFVRLVATGLSPLDESDHPFGLQLVSMEVVKDAIEPSSVPAPAAPIRRYQSSSDFSATQGANRWGYVYLARLNLGRTENWSPLAFDGESGCWLSERTESRIGSDWQCSSRTMDTARVWRAPGAGAIRISGEAVVSSGPGRVGIRVGIKVMRNRQGIWPARGWRALIAGAALRPEAVVSVNRGDRIFFVTTSSGSDPGIVTWDPLVEFFPITERSVASSCFSDQQGSAGWFYSTSAGDMSWNRAAGCWRGAGGGGSIQRDSQRPSAGMDAVRTWSAPGDGIVTISGHIQSADARGRGRVLVRITRNRSPVWPARGWRAIQPAETQALTAEAAAEVRSGDRIHFRARCGDGGPATEIIWDPTCTFHGIVPSSLV